MPDENLHFSYDPATGIVRVTVTGPWPAGEAYFQFRKQFAALGAPEDAPALVDLRGVESGSEPRYADLTRSARAAKLTDRDRRAYLTQPGTQYGVARMIKALAPEDVAIEVFTDEDAALAWLTGSDIESY